MGRAKKKRKALQKKKRQQRKNNGKYVPFSLANYPKVLNGRVNKHDVKTNIHNLTFKGSKFQNVKYTSANMTACKFTDSNLIGIDFINTRTCLKTLPYCVNLKIAAI